MIPSGNRVTELHRKAKDIQTRPDEIFCVYAVYPDHETALKAVRQLVAQRWIACANLIALGVSIYEWNGAIEETQEVAAILKTTGSKVDALIHQIALLHPYEVPCVVAWPVETGHGDFLNWVKNQVRHLRQT